MDPKKGKTPAAKAGPQYWAKLINAGIVRTVDGFISIGQALLDARDEMERGEWERMFVGHPQAVKKPIMFSIRTAQRFMVVARLRAKATDLSCLPPHLTVLAEIARWPATLIEAAVTDGVIRPNMGLAAVRKTPWLMDQTGALRYPGATKKKRDYRPSRAELHRLGRRFHEALQQQRGEKPEYSLAERRAWGQMKVLLFGLANNVRSARDAMRYFKVGGPVDLEWLSKVRDAVAELSGIVAEMYQEIAARAPVKPTVISSAVEMRQQHHPGAEGADRRRRRAGGAVAASIGGPVEPVGGPAQVPSAS
jgi:hypothetical protein